MLKNWVIFLQLTNYLYLLNFIDTVKNLTIFVEKKEGDNLTNIFLKEDHTNSILKPY